LNCCLALKAANPRKKVSIVTKDTGLRIRAITWGCEAENYRSDLIQQDRFTGLRSVQIENSDDWTKLWANTDVEVSSLSKELINSMGELYPNEFLIFEYGDLKCPTIP